MFNISALLFYTGFCKCGVCKASETKSTNYPYLKVAEVLQEGCAKVEPV
jgi:hypothetical protein